MQRCENMKFRDRHNAVFVGFAPAKDPAIAVAVIGEHACHGGTGAAPIARAVIKKYLEKYYPDLYGEKVLASRLKSMGQSPVIPKEASPPSVDDDVTTDDNENLISPKKERLRLPRHLCRWFRVKPRKEN